VFGGVACDAEARLTNGLRLFGAARGTAGRLLPIGSALYA